MKKDKQPKRWFDNWLINRTVVPDSKGKGQVLRLEVVLPHAYGGTSTIFYLDEYDVVRQGDIEELFSILISAFNQIQKDNSGYKDEVSTVSK